ncbi:TonB-dependent receptor, partial [bacterium]|nr:TonB-dependent receptor [bacterium]
MCGFIFAVTLQAQQNNYSIEGSAKDLYTGKGLPSVNVYIQELQRGAITDSSGSYKIGNLSKGIYTVAFTRVGYKKQTRKINFEKYFVVQLSVKLEEQSIVFEAIEITPGVIELSSEEGASSTITNQEILSSASIFSKDVYRSLQVVPGVSNSEWSSKPHIKGGNPDEMAVIIDNLEIYEPFHLEEIDGPYSVISSDLVKDMKLITGGFAPKYGDKMSGILKINTIDRVDDDSIKASIDFSNASAALNQRISDRVNVFFSGRRSYVYLLEQASDNNFPTVVYDLWSKLDYKMDAQNRLSVNFMFLKDEIKYKQDSTFLRREFFDSYKMNYYVWLNWYKLTNERRYYSTTVGFQNLDKHADFSFDGSFTDDNADRRSTKIATFKQDHYWKWRDDHTLEFGLDGNVFFNDYFYREFRVNPTETTPYAISTDVILVDSKTEGYTASGYAQDTYRFSDKINMLLGVRLSSQSYTDVVQIAPRAALSYEYSGQLNFKWAYGWYYQPDNFQKMKAYDNQYKLYSKPEKSIHYVMSAAYAPDPNSGITADAYYKDYPRLNDDYNFDFSNRIEGVGIVDKPYNTQSGYAAGFDLFFKKRYGAFNLLSVGYSFSVSR